MITVSICLTDLPKDKIAEAKNGKKYINIVVDKRKDVGNYGETHTVYLSQSKEEREAKENRVYVGSGKEYTFEKRETEESSDGLPF